MHLIIIHQILVCIAAAKEIIRCNRIIRQTDKIRICGDPNGNVSPLILADHNLLLACLRQFPDTAACLFQTDMHRILLLNAYQKFLHVLLGGLGTYNPPIDHGFLLFLGVNDIGKSFMIE